MMSTIELLHFSKTGGDKNEELWTTAQWKKMKTVIRLFY